MAKKSILFTGLLASAFLCVGPALAQPGGPGMGMKGRKKLAAPLEGKKKKPAQKEEEKKDEKKGKHKGKAEKHKGKKGKGEGHGADKKGKGGKNKERYEKMREHAKERREKRKEHAEERRKERRAEVAKMIGEKGKMSEALKQELRRHAMRTARLDRAQEIGAEKEDDKILDRVEKLRKKENERHTRWMTHYAEKTKEEGAKPDEAEKGENK